MAKKGLQVTFSRVQSRRPGTSGHSEDANHELSYVLFGSNGFATFDEPKDFSTSFINPSESILRSFYVGIQNNAAPDLHGRMFRIYDLILAE